MPREADFVSEISTTTGTGNLVLAGAVSGYRTFNAAFSSADADVHYGIMHETDGSREIGTGTFLSGSNALQRVTVHASTNGGSKVSFAAGNKIVYIASPAEGSLISRIRRPGDVGLDIIPAAGQTAAMLRVQNASGGTVASIMPSGSMTATALTLSPSSPADGSVLATLGIAQPWRVRQHGTTPNSDLEIAPVADGRYVRFSSASGLSGIRISPETSTILTINGDHSMNFRSAGGNEIRFYTQWADTGSVDARIVPGGPSATIDSVIMTRQKGDARYQIASSSAALKQAIASLAEVDTTAIQPRRWVWNMDGHPRNGLAGAGFVYEEVAEAFPEAVYPPQDGESGGVDALALLAAFVASTREALASLDARITALEA